MLTMSVVVAHCTIGLGVGVAVGTGLGVGDGVGEGVGVGVGEGLGLDDGVGLGLDDAVGTGVAVATGVGVGVGAGVGAAPSQYVVALKPFTSAAIVVPDATKSWHGGKPGDFATIFAIFSLNFGMTPFRGSFRQASTPVGLPFAKFAAPFAQHFSSDVASFADSLLAVSTFFSTAESGGTKPPPNSDGREAST